MFLVLMVGDSQRIESWLEHKRGILVLQKEIAKVVLGSSCFLWLNSWCERSTCCWCSSVCWGNKQEVTHLDRRTRGRLRWFDYCVLVEAFTSVLVFRVQRSIWCFEYGSRPENQFMRAGK